MPELFPAELIGDAFARASAPPSRPARCSTPRPRATPGLRALLGQRFARRGLACRPGDLLVTTDSQRALGLVAAVLLEPDALPELIAEHAPKFLYVVRRRDALLDGPAAVLPEGSSFNRPGGGMFVRAWLPEGWDADALLRTALEHDVASVPGHPFFAQQPDHRTLRLSFTTHVPAEIDEARLARAAASA